jgi:hypothetical protein
LFLAKKAKNSITITGFFQGCQLVRQQNLAYTQHMHSIDSRWTDLAAGYQAVQSLQGRLETEFGRAMQAGEKQKFHKELTEWQKKRRAFFVMAGIAPLSIITLCVAAFYLREVACVIVYWTLLVGIILVTLAVAGRNFIREAMNRPKPENMKTLPLDLEQRWWAGLSPQELTVVNAEEKDRASFLRMAGQALPEGCLVIRAPAPLLFSPAGMWLFQIVPWSGSIVRQGGVWKESQSVRDKLGREQTQVQTHQAAPDEEWLGQKNELTRILKERRPELAWTTSLIQGGVVFTHPKANLDKPHIQGNTAAYGLARAWVERIRGGQAVDGFTQEIQLEILEALHAPQSGPAASAKELAERLYQEGADELRQSIAKMVNATG